MTETQLQAQLDALLLPVLALVGLSVIMRYDHYLKRSKKRLLLVINVIVLTLIAATCTTNALVAAWRPEYVPLHTAVSVYCYIARPVIIVLFIYMVWDDPKRRLFWIPVGLNAAVFLTTFFKPWAFVITPDGYFLRGPLGYTAHWVSALLLIALLVVTLVTFSRARRGDMAIPVMNACVAALGPIMDEFFHQNGAIPFAELMTVFCCMFFYIWLHMQYVADHEQDLIDAHRLRLLISQIQPHFLFNTLTTIRGLVLSQPRKAAEVTDRFTAYLRRNIDSLNETDLIPFRKELDHALVYAEIELESLPDAHIDYEIDDEGFELPALTLQPLVENAIRHGIRGVKHGQVLISTALIDGCHEITVTDNGRGFDVNAQAGAQGNHIGIQNVRDRLEKLCGGTLTIDSAQGVGTVVKMRIPAIKEET